MNPHWLTLRRSATALGLVLASALLATPARAQVAETGIVRGRVIDGATRDPLGGTTVTIVWPEAPGAPPREESQVTQPNGGFAFPAVPAGTYRLRFSKPGFRDSSMTDFVVVAGQENLADFPLPPLPTAASDPAPDVEEFVVVASPLEEILEASRMESDQLLNTMSAEEISKFAASDVADALRFVPGVNVVKGQFAIIRGLEDRYSSTLYNSAPVPSPDPDSQSVQLDLFPSDIVTNLAIAKTFGPDLPSNSSGGSINIITHEYPEQTELKLSFGSGFNENAEERFLDFEPGMPVGEEVDGSDVIEDDTSMSLAGRGHLGEREARYKALYSREVDYETKEGFHEARQPRLATFAPFGENSELADGVLGLSDGSYDLVESERTAQQNGYLGFGVDLDRAGNHKLDVSSFFTEKDEETVELRENGFLPSEDYDFLFQDFLNGGDNLAITTSAPGSTLAKLRANNFEPQSRGPLVIASFSESQSYQRDRDLLVTQVNGDHQIEQIEGLHVRWAANYARTTQDEQALGLNYAFEPFDTSSVPASVPVAEDALGEGYFLANSGIFVSANDVEEGQYFARLDGDYELPLSEIVTFQLTGGGWREDADRDVGADFLEIPTVDRQTNISVLGSTELGLANQVYDDLDRQPNGELNLRKTTNEGVRDILAWHLGGKATVWEDLDLLAGFRRESIKIESLNDPFIAGELAADGSPLIFPTKYLFFDRQDNPAKPGERAPAPGTIFNDQLLGIEPPVDPVTGFVDLETREEIESLVNGEIDEERTLPSYGVTYRPIEGMALRTAFSKTVARPSFREMGYYVTVEPGSTDLIIGNPQLQLSDVESWDARLEYSFGDFGDLAAVSVFKKDIEKPIESIVVRNPNDVSSDSGAQYRTFFNNPDTADVRGIELEGRKNLAFLGPDIAEYFSIGGNYTYIDAEVDRTEAELSRASAYFRVAPGQTAPFPALEDSRRLFGQPEWIGNVDVSFNHPDWGTKITLALFTISDILDAAGTAAVSADGIVRSITLDRYIDSYTQLDLVMSQTWHIDLLGGDVTFKASLKNLTDSTRSIIYDPEQTQGTIEERSYTVGTDLAVSIGYKISF